MAELSARRTLDWRLEARTGYTTADAHAHLAALPEGRFDVVVLSMGVSDVTKRHRPREMAGAAGALADMLQTRFASRAVLFTALPPMHLFPRCRSRCVGTWAPEPATSMPRLADWLPGPPAAICRPRSSSPTRRTSPATVSIPGRLPMRRGRRGLPAISTGCSPAAASDSPRSLIPMRPLVLGQGEFGAVPRPRCLPGGVDDGHHGQNLLRGVGLGPYPVIARASSR